MRFLRLVLSFFIILTIVFFLPRVAPGDPIENILGLDYVSATPEQIEFLKEQYGLDKSLFEQYALFIKSIFTFNFGYSISSNSEVGYLVFESMKFSVMITLLPLFLGALIALSVGMHAGTNKGKKWEIMATGMVALFYAIPNYIVGILLLSLLSFKLRIFPLGHLSSGDDSGIIDIIYHMILPETILTISVFCGYYIIIRNAVFQINDEYFIMAKRIHGFSEEYINSNHISRNIATQFVSMFALSLGGIIGGTLIIEIIFSLPGMGSLLFKAISFGDYPLIQACFIFITASVLIANMVAEVLYVILDPRVDDGMYFDD